MEQRQPEQARQRHDAWVGEELGKVGAHRLGRGRRGRAEIDEKGAAQCCESALESSFAVMSTIGTTRS